MSKSWFSHCVCIVNLIATVTITITPVHGSCYKAEMESDVQMPGFYSQRMRYNVCVDNTTIYPRIAETPQSTVYFERDCCGCRVSGFVDTEVQLLTLTSPSRYETVFIPNIQFCECIPCNNRLYSWTNYFNSLPNII
ncbi:uncharacterized protein LOC131957875 [Physella acuta]|uniref:uncharacterized protein LOC131957875 n=1 Tax=Physella acuta TaxID=109671 RepID=UPI0027DCAD4C|nr:uncharacterized protein LOC131957875 [Physella acuta]